MEELRLTDEEIRQKVRVNYNPDWDEAQLFNAALRAVADAQLTKARQHYEQEKAEAVREERERIINLMHMCSMINVNDPEDSGQTKESRLFFQALSGGE